MNKNSVTPLYQQLYETILGEIASGKLKEKDKLMTEQELSEYYDVSRITVRKAIELLAEEGYVIKKQGIGTFIAAKKLNRVFDRVMSFTETCREDGKTASSRVLEAKIEKASTTISKKLKIKSGRNVVKIKRVRLSDDVPVMLEENYSTEAYSFVLDEDLEGSLYEIYRKHGIVPRHALKTVEICYATPEEAMLLNVLENQALLLHKDLTMDEDGQIIHYSKLVINPEKYKLTMIQ